MTRIVFPSISKTELDDFEFTDAQKKAYDKLIEACKRCEKAGLILCGKQDGLHAFPEKFRNLMTADKYEASNHEIPRLKGAKINDCGADDTEFFKKGTVV